MEREVDYWADPGHPSQVDVVGHTPSQVDVIGHPLAQYDLGAGRDGGAGGWGGRVD